MECIFFLLESKTKLNIVFYTVIESTIYVQCPRVKEVIFSNNVETVDGL